MFLEYQKNSCEVNIIVINNLKITIKKLDFYNY